MGFLIRLNATTGHSKSYAFRPNLSARRPARGSTSLVCSNQNRLSLTVNVTHYMNHYMEVRAVHGKKSVRM